MGPFLWGSLAGFLLAAVIAAAVGAFAYRRFVLLERRTRQAERLAELGTLTGGLAHEIKNPLSTVQLNLQLLREDLDPRDPTYGRISNRLNTVQREAARLRDILDDFLRFAGQIELDRKPTDVNQLLEDLVDFFMPQAQLQKVRLHLRKADGQFQVALDERLVKQAVLNLMLNAVQAMDGRGGELILSASRSADEALIDVVDTGKGIPPDEVGKIFGAYYSKRRGGTGLGLAMSQRIAREHAGRITVKSELGKGSDFTLHLPLK